MNNEKRNKYQKVMFLGIMIMSVAGIVLATLIWNYWNDDKKTNEYVTNYSSVNSQQEQVDKDKEETESVSEPQSEEIIPEIPWYEQISVDLDGAKQNNSNIIGWIYLENEDINYPILYSGDNEKYLHTGVDETRSSTGSIFLDGKNNINLEDSRSIIYGHNMQNLSMFGILKYYVSDDEYYLKHPYFQIFIDDKVYRYHIFAYSIEDPSENIDQIQFDSSEEFMDYIHYLERKSYISSEIEVDSSDHVITLYTCSANNKKLLIHAVRDNSYCFSSGEEGLQ